MRYDAYQRLVRALREQAEAGPTVDEMLEALDQLGVVHFWRSVQGHWVVTMDQSPGAPFTGPTPTAAIKAAWEACCRE